MHIEYLYYFKDFSRTLSISKTAAHYFMTPQGLSRALHQLEKDFGVTLMTYQNNLISLTPAGEELSRRIDAIVELYDEAKGSLTEYKLADMAPSKGLVRITVTSCVSQYLISLLNLQRPGQFPFGGRKGNRLSASAAQLRGAACPAGKEMRTLKWKCA